MLCALGEEQTPSTSTAIFIPTVFCHLSKEKAGLTFQSCQERGWSRCWQTLPLTSVSEVTPLCCLTFKVLQRPSSFHSGGRREGLPWSIKCLINQPFIKQCSLEGGALARAMRMTCLLCEGSLTGFCLVGTPGGPGFRIPDIFPFHSAVGPGILIIAHGEISISFFLLLNIILILVSSTLHTLYCIYRNIRLTCTQCMPGTIEAPCSDYWGCVWTHTSHTTTLIALFHRWGTWTQR